MAKPASHIDWTDGNPSKVTEPTGSKKLLGWIVGERPAFQFMNWLFYNVDQWIKYLEGATDTTLAALSVIDAVVDPAGGAGVYTTLQAAHDAVSPGARIFVRQGDTINSVILFTKSEIEVIFKPNVTYTKGGGAPLNCIKIQAGCSGVIIRNGRFVGWTGGGDSALLIQAGATFTKVTDSRFGPSSTAGGITDQSGDQSVIYGTIQE